MKCKICLINNIFDPHDSGNAIYCLDCRIKNRKSFKPILQGIDRTRELVRKRDNYQCQDCKKNWKIGTRRFDVHHLNGLCGKKSKKYDKVSEMSSLVTLCHKCHFNRKEHKSKKLSTV